jgi:Tfp pilus assembly PilM family ATPase/Tfp pilus assembly protein PilN
LTVTINISSQSLKITAGRNALIEHWGSLPVMPGLIKDGLILEPDTIGKQLKAYFEKERLPRNSVITSLTGASYVYRLLRLPHVPANRLREAIERATQKEIHLDLADLYIDWDVIGECSGETEFFVTGIPRRSIETLLQAFKIADIKLRSVDLSSLALARVADKKETLLVNFEPDCFDIAIITGGIPVTLHSILPKTRDSNLEDKVMQLSDELTRTIDFYNLTHKENLILPGASLVLSGSLAADSTASESLQNILGFSVSTLKSGLAFPPDFPLSTYSVNLGLALKRKASNIIDFTQGEVFRDININLLYGRKRALTRHYSFRQLLVTAGLALAAVFLTPAFLFVNESKVQSAAMKSELATIIHQINQRQIALEQDFELHNVIDSINEDTLKIQGEIELVAGRGELSKMIRTLIDCLPSDAKYSNIECETKQIAIDGLAADRASVISYARALEKSTLFSSVRIALLDEKIDKTASLKVAFQLVVER